MLGVKRVCRVRIANDELEKMSKEDLRKSWLLQEQYVEYIEGKLNENTDHSELVSLRESEEKLKQQQLEAIRKENILVMRLTTKEQEMQEYAGQIQELKQSQIPSISQLKAALLDPAVNYMFDRMRKEIDSLKARLEESQNELNAWKFTPDSVTGKRLMAKCRLLYQENEELGKMISSGRIAKLEGDLALQKTFTEELKKSQTEVDDLLLELDEDFEGLQSTVCYLQQQLRESKEQIQKLQQKNEVPEAVDTSQFNHNYLNNDECSEINEKALTASPCNNSNNSALESSSVPQSTFETNPVEDTNLKSITEPVSDKPWLEEPPVNNETNEHKILNLHIKTELPESETDLETNRDTLNQHSPPPIKTIKQEFVPVETPPTDAVPSQHLTIPVRGSLHMEEYDSEQETEPPKAIDNKSLLNNSNNTLSIDIKNEHDSTPNITAHTPPEKPQPIVDKRTTSQNCNTTGSSKGRKRTRNSKLQVAEESSVSEPHPKVKRLRRRDIIVEQDVKPDNRTHIEIDNTDAEVEVAQALVNMSASQKDRKDINLKTQDCLNESMGNGEFLKRKNNLENA